MAYTPPSNNAIDFELKAYSAPSSSSIDFTLEDSGGGTNYPVSHVESTIAADTITLQASFVSSRSEANTATDTLNTPTIRYPVSRVEANTAADTTDATIDSGSVNYPVDHTESTTAADTRTVLATFVSSRSESASAADILNAPLATYRPSQVETNTASDTSLVIVSAVRIEANTASDILNTPLVGYRPSQIESNTALDNTPAPQVGYKPSHVEATSATDIIPIPLVIRRVSQAEANTASDSFIIITAASVSEATSATDTLNTPIVNFKPSQVEATNAADANVSSATLYATRVESNTATDTSVVVIPVSRVESNTATSTEPIPLINRVGALLDSNLASDNTSGLSTLKPSTIEVNLAVDSFTVRTGYTHVESNTVGSTQSASVIFNVSTTENFVANDLRTRVGNYVGVTEESNLSTDSLNTLLSLLASHIENISLEDIIVERAGKIRSIGDSLIISDLFEHREIYSRNIISGETLYFRDTEDITDALSARRIISRSTKDIMKAKSRREENMGLAVALADEESVSDEITFAGLSNRIVANISTIVSYKDKN